MRMILAAAIAAAMFCVHTDAQSAVSYLQTSGSISQPKTLQQKISTTGTQVALPAAVATSVTCRALSSNSAAILFGGQDVTNVSDGTGNGWIAAPGDGFVAIVNNASAVYINGSAGDIVTCVVN